MTFLVNKRKGLDKVERHASGRMKTVCVSAVLAFFGIAPDYYHYAACRNDINRILRRFGFGSRSRMSKMGKNPTVGSVREKIKALGEPGYYYVSVPGHAMLLDDQGRTVVDTAPRSRDRRRVLAVSRIAVFAPRARSL